MKRLLLTLLLLLAAPEAWAAGCAGTGACYWYVAAGANGKYLACRDCINRTGNTGWVWLPGPGTVLMMGQ